jgi:tRNA(fMet)-specific endonuclease VapC
MKYMLDTDTLIYFLRQKPPSVSDRLNALAEDDSIGMSFVTWAELLKGAEGSVRRAEVLKRLSVLARSIPVMYPARSEICSHYARHASRLKAEGKPIGGNDLWIASHALAEGATLVTSNVGEFTRIRGLPVENWAVV